MDLKNIIKTRLGVLPSGLSHMSAEGRFIFITLSESEYPAYLCFFVREKLVEAKLKTGKTSYYFSEPQNSKYRCPYSPGQENIPAGSFWGCSARSL